MEDSVVFKNNKEIKRKSQSRKKFATLYAQGGLRFLVCRLLCKLIIKTVKDQIVKCTTGHKKILHKRYINDQYTCEKVFNFTKYQRIIKLYQNAIPRLTYQIRKDFFKTQRVGSVKENVHSLILYVEI